MCIYEYYYVYIYILCGTTTELDVCLVRTKPNNFMTHNKSLRVAPEATWASGTNCGATCCVRMMKCLIVVLMFVSPCQAGADARRLQPRPCVRTGQQKKSPPSWEPLGGLAAMLEVHGVVSPTALPACSSNITGGEVFWGSTVGSPHLQPRPCVWTGLQKQGGSTVGSPPGARGPRQALRPHLFRKGFRSCRQPTQTSTCKHPTPPSIIGGEVGCHPPHTQPLRHF